MKNMFKSYHNVMLFKERTEFQEFGHAKKDFRVCPECSAVYFKKSWHHWNEDILIRAKAGKLFIYDKCPACSMIAGRQYEGVLAIEDIPQKFEQELMNLVKSYTKKAYEKDCQHRLIGINKQGKNKWIVTTTENQLANRLAHKIRDVFGKVEVRTAYSEAPDDLERVTVHFLPALGLSVR